jgi:hypothetical protein
MKPFGLLFLILAALVPAAAAQPPAPASRPALPRVETEKLGVLPPNADTRFAALKAKVPPGAWSWIESQARVEAGRPAPDPAALKSEIAKRFGSGLPPAEVDAVTFLVLAQANQDLESDLRNIVAHSQIASPPPSQEARKDAKDNLGEVSQTAQLRLQTVMDRRSKLIETLSNVLKKMSDTDSSIVGNLK